MEESLEEQNIKFVSFREPDIGDELTAIAILPSEEARHFCKGFKLAKMENAPVAQPGRATVSKTVDAGSNPAGSAKGSDLMDPEKFKTFPAHYVPVAQNERLAVIRQEDGASCTPRDANAQVA